MSDNSEDLTVQIGQELLSAKQEQITAFRNEILLNQVKQITYDTSLLSHSLDEAIQKKYSKVSGFISVSSFSIDTIIETIQRVQNDRMEIPKKRIVLGKKITEFVKMILSLLDTTWSIMEHFKYKRQKEKNIFFDQYYLLFVDTLLLKVKILHLTILISIYDKEFISSLESIKNILEKRYLDAESMLKYTTEKLEEYNDFGPEFETLSVAYKQLIDKIQSTKDDINRIKNY